MATPTLPNYGALAPGYYNEEELAFQNATSDLTGFDKGLIKNSIFNVSPSLSEYMPSLPSTNDMKSFGSWFVGNKDFSPLGMVFGLGEGYLNYKNARDDLKFQKQKHKDQMDFARYNALADINADMANANMQLLRWQGFNPERASEYAKSFYNSFQDIAKQAESIGIPPSSLSNGLNQLSALAYKDK